mgnify:FL=1|tara:strand:+ start:603 stop:833 length:231 start_codon:yes stop_codon:yes gene_type:complete
MQFNKSKSTKRFNFNINRDTVSHKVGSNTVSITTNAPDDSYYTSRSQITMTVKEARAFQGFLNTYIDGKTIAPTID